MNAIRKWLAVAMCAPLVSGCESTGDPRQGGLFGWSEQKALARQDLLLQDGQLARQQLAAQQQRAATLGDQQVALATETAGLKAELGRLLEENGALDAQLRALMQRRRLGQDDAARLRRMLADNAQLRQAARASASGGARPQAGAVSDQNARLHREVMILLR